MSKQEIEKIVNETFSLESVTFHSSGLTEKEFKSTLIKNILDHDALAMKEAEFSASDRSLSTLGEKAFIPLIPGKLIIEYEIKVDINNFDGQFAYKVKALGIPLSTGSLEYTGNKLAMPINCSGRLISQRLKLTSTMKIELKDKKFCFDIQGMFKTSFLGIINKEYPFHSSF
ncbi:hypothetical protein [Xenorhabdus bovienii]|uniref:hypothetical protein n=1 Tax=Xenorhabdus bovienii TaxID=40576 RepID=UPI0023B2C3B3|nr:hypothetical protein [Xenorhabdus bovienii]MDE9536891.1 hypothetical protein [Xenorhabdus bovienii]MDE9589902.1 hypothetical protein [Xenorhabdus bovienii]